MKLTCKAGTTNSAVHSDNPAPTPQISLYLSSWLSKLRASHRRIVKVGLEARLLIWEDKRQIELET